MRINAAASFGVVLLLAGCASHQLVVVLPPSDPKGHIGGVEVTACNKTVLLDTAYSEEFTDCHAETAKADEVDKQFHDALEARPLAPATFKLYFVYGTPNLTDKSEKEFPNVFSDIAQRKAAEIVITGHTDPIGNDIDNDKLALSRAEIIKTRFQELEKVRQAPTDLTISTVSRGRRDAEIPLGVNCRNSKEDVCEEARKVEITVQ